MVRIEKFIKTCEILKEKIGEENFSYEVKKEIYEWGEEETCHVSFFGKNTEIKWWSDIHRCNLWGNLPEEQCDEIVALFEGNKKVEIDEEVKKDYLEVLDKIRNDSLFNDYHFEYSLDELTNEYDEYLPCIVGYSDFDNNVCLAFGDISFMYLSNAGFNDEECEKLISLFEILHQLEEFAPIDDSFDTMVLCHGIATGYSGSVNENEAILRSQKILDGIGEICCSNIEQHIGAFGFYIKGHNEVVSNIDLKSKVVDGKRKVPESWRLKGIIKTKEEIDLTQWDHTEHIVSNYNVKGFWIKDWAVAHYPELINFITSIGLSIDVVGKRRDA